MKGCSSADTVASPAVPQLGHLRATIQLSRFTTPPLSYAYMLHSSENGSQLRSFSTLRTCSVATAHSSEGIDHTLHRDAARARKITLPVACTGHPRSILVSLRW